MLCMAGFEARQFGGEWIEVEVVGGCRYKVVLDAGVKLADKVGHGVLRALNALTPRPPHPCQQQRLLQGGHNINCERASLRPYLVA